MDERLSDLERAAAAGDAEARVPLLAQRLRAGAITLARVEVAAFLGDAAAARVVGPPPAPHFPPREELWALWVDHRLDRDFGREPAVRAGAALVRWAEAELEGEGGEGLDGLRRLAADLAQPGARNTLQLVLRTAHLLVAARRQARRNWQETLEERAAAKAQAWAAARAAVIAWALGERGA